MECRRRSSSPRKGRGRGVLCPPLLFNLVGETLSCLFKKALDVDLIKGIRLVNSDVVVSHIQFADNLLVFSEANEGSLVNVKRILKIFEMAVGLSLNLKKSKLVRFNVAPKISAEWASLIQCSQDSLPMSYLGLPVGNRRNSKDLWNPIIDKVQTRLAGWKVEIPDFKFLMGIVWWKAYSVIPDFWTEVPSLRLSFSLIYDLALNKASYFNEFGSKFHGVWHWSIEISRPLSDAEVPCWEDFIGTLNRATLSSSSSDMLEVNVPPKVATFTWKVILSRIPVRAELTRRGILSVGTLAFAFFVKKNRKWLIISLSLCEDMVFSRNGSQSGISVYLLDFVGELFSLVVLDCSVRLSVLKVQYSGWLLLEEEFLFFTAARAVCYLLISKFIVLIVEKSISGLL
ncbi:uncharacterized protein LOC120118802 [Hibiscus syriacus]|uniref:uncharacterized protein LOC120118802 n=1 Tax=Hibiscus syriacus TaxID=106335 RepID=UPI0019203DFC|nr:uncharacterized protein LOC120118802 [Hibiscus syriacus]